MYHLHFIGRRLLHLVPVLIGISLVSFLLVMLVPGDPVRLVLGPRATEAAVAAMRENWGLDHPLYLQYLTYVGNVIQGDLGESLKYRLPVRQLILEYLPRTAFLVGYVLVITLPATVLLAVIAARREGQWPDQLIRLFSVLGMTIPVFWLAVLFARVFGIQLGWFPVSGYGEGFLDHVHHLFLPAVSTALWLVPVLTRNLRGALIQQMEADYVAACRAKGLPERQIFSRHILPNSILPTLNLLGVMIAFLIGGSVVVEIVYAVPGLGALMIGAVLGRDYFVIQGLTLIYALATVVVTLLIDLLTAAIDPRING